MKKINNNLLNIFVIIVLLFIGGCKKKEKEDLSKAFVKYYGGLLKNAGAKVLQTSDGGYVIAGTTNTGTGPGDILVIKTDNEGNETWHKTLGAAAVYDECGSIAIMPDGGYVVVGTSEFKPGQIFDITALDLSKDSTNVFAVRMDPSGNVIWSKHYDNPSNPNVKIGAFGKAVVVNSNGQCFFAGMVDSSFSIPLTVNLNLYAFLVDNNGDVLQVGGIDITAFQYGARDQNDYTNDAIKAYDLGLGDEYIISSSTIIGGVNTPRIVKVRLNGNIITQNVAIKNTDWSENSYCSAGQMTKTSDNNYMLTGTNGTPPSSSDIFMIKLLAADLTKMQSYSYGDLSGYENLGVSVISTNDGGYALLGITNSPSYTGDPAQQNDVLFIKVDMNGVEQWHKVFGGKGNDSASNIIQTSDGGYLICGTISFGDDVSNTGISNTITLIKMDSNGDISNLK
jgi:hypothetical protein